MRTEAEKPIFWIDIENAPHVPLFTPIIQELTKTGKVWLTARRSPAILHLLDTYNLHNTAIVLGTQARGSKFLKALAVLWRSLLLARKATRTEKRPVIAVSHGSRSQAIASKLTGIPAVVLYDYEYANLSVFVRTARWLMVPEYVHLEPLREAGFLPKQILTYPGIKEMIYCWAHEPRLLPLAQKDKVIVAVRTPAFDAHYYTSRSGELFSKTLRWLASQKEDIQVFLLLRHPNEIREVTKIIDPHKPPFTILPMNTKGEDILYTADVFIGGGGTMCREATLYGCHTYSIFGGKRGGVDLWLSQQGKLTFVEEPEQITLAKKRERKVFRERSVFDFVIKTIIELVGKATHR